MSASDAVADGRRTAAAPGVLSRALQSAVWTIRAEYAAAALLAAVGVVHAGAFYHDDAFISLRYAARWLAGQGLTWNSGEWVEGFTHPLWLAQVAALGALGIDLERASRFVGLSYLIALFLLWRASRAEPIFLLVLATQPGLLLWTVGGLETTAFCFWLALGAWSVQEAVWASADNEARRWAILGGGALAASALMRPEGAGAGMVAIAVLAARRRWQPTIAAVIAFTALAGMYELFRVAYFGDLLPNTAYAKLGGLPIDARLSAGLTYLYQTQDIWLPSVIVAATGLFLARGRLPMVMLLVPAPVLLCVLGAGGDHMVGARLLVPSLVTLLLAAAIASRSGLANRLLFTGLVGVVALAQFIALLLTPVECDPAAVTGEHVGRFLEAELAAGATVASATAGSTPYFAPSLRFIDTLGLNDRHIAHREVHELRTKWQHQPGHLKGDGAYVLARAPDVIILGPAEGFLGTQPDDWFLTDLELLSSPEFRAQYRPYRFLIRVTPDSIARRPLHLRVDSNPYVVLVLYLRINSPAVAGLMNVGDPLRLPPQP